MLRQNAWNVYSEEDAKQVEAFARSYRNFLDYGKTERECVKQIKAIAKEKGFVDLEEVMNSNKKLVPGDKVIMTHMGKLAALFVIGKKPLEQGLHIVGAHIDSPRMDLKQNPLFEDGSLAYLDTHYYGGVKKYQWVTQPLALHGVVVKKDGSVLEFTIGEKDEDPVLGISDLLIHVSQNQLEKKASVVIEGEDLNLIVGSKPLEDAESDPVKAMIVKVLEEEYNIEEEDFVRAELEVVPAGKSRDFGLDRSMILGYGHDDKCCAYPTLQAILSIDEAPEYTAMALFTDKEEIGSVGATGSHSRVIENTVAELCALTGEYSDLKTRRAMQHSRVLSADVTSVFDPTYAAEFEKKNTAFMGLGLTINKYTGSRGKSGANDASAEYVAAVTRIFDDNKVAFQTSEIGKVDHGGGGTIAYILGNYGAEVVDCGVPVMSMHAPYEIISKADLYEAYKGYLAFMKHKR
ncbi:putative M18-family aminopeptidase 1 [Lachnospiraceae bacterium TWA4]|nr:putative M18-family aminopeptidase 1 [Lachnospiraceae bacterium TWA4]